MKGKRYTTEQKIRVLRQAEQSHANIIDVCRQHGISEQSFHTLQARVCMMDLDRAK